MSEQVDLFEKASRLKLRFESNKGSITVEDLWDLPLVTTTSTGASLNNVAQKIAKAIKETETESFVEDVSTTDKVLQLKLEVVKYIIVVKKAEGEKARLLRENKEKKAKILGILAQKEDEKLLSSSVDELKALLVSL